MDGLNGSQREHWRGNDCGSSGMLESATLGVAGKCVWRWKLRPQSEIFQVASRAATLLIGGRGQGACQLTERKLNTQNE